MLFLVTVRQGGGGLRSRDPSRPVMKSNYCCARTTSFDIPKREKTILQTYQVGSLALLSKSIIPDFARSIKKLNQITFQ